MRNENVNKQQNQQSCQTSVSGSFYHEIMASKETKFYGKLIKEYSNHDIGNVYIIYKQFDGTLYSGDSRGIGQGGYVSNVIDLYFKKSSESEYVSQNYR